MKFNLSKNGYNIEDVDNYISNLTIQYEQKLSEQKDRVFSLRNELRLTSDKIKDSDFKGKQISLALYNAVEKAEKIEESAKNLYDLEIKRIRLLYNKWGNVINKIKEKLPEDFFDKYITLILNEFENGVNSIINNSLTLEKSSVKNNIKNASDNYVKNLLNKMDYVVRDSSSLPIETEVLKMNEMENARLKALDDKLSLMKTTNLGGDKANGYKNYNDVNPKVKGKYSINIKVNDNILKSSENIDGKSVILNKKSKYQGDKNDGSIIENYLNDDTDIVDNIYTKNIARSEYLKNNKKEESGFDINDAINTKEDLDEIMKAFDFFNVDNKKK